MHLVVADLGHVQPGDRTHRDKQTASTTLAVIAGSG